MEIITRVRINMATGTEIERESFEYQGPVAQCGSSGGSQYDSDYNARMAAIAESQQTLSEDAYNTYKQGAGSFQDVQVLTDTGYGKAYETVQQWVADDPDNVSQLQLEQDMLNASSGLLPKQVAMADKGLDANMAEMDASMSLIQPGTDLQLASIADKQADISGMRPIKDELYTQTMQGLDINESMRTAGSDTAQGINRVNQDRSAYNKARGVAPTGGMNALDQVKAIAGARTNARTTAKNENYNRLSTFRGL